MHDKYLESFALLIKLWNETVRSAVFYRTRTAIDALLPVETIENVKKTCVYLATEEILQKVNDWRRSHMKGTGLCKIKVFSFKS